MKRPLLLVIGALSICVAQGPAVLAPGDPPLTQGMAQKLADVYSNLLEIRLTSEQGQRFEQGLVSYWKKNDRESIESSLGNLKYAGQRDELAALRTSSQLVIVEAMRRDPNDPVSAVLIEAYDAAHPDRKAATRARGAADLIGIWKREDGLMAEKYPGRSPSGVSYTDSATLEISADGRFKHIKVHNHCSGSGGCCRMDGATEHGTISLEGTKLAFDVQSGSEMVRDGCAPGLASQSAIKPRKESFVWSIRKDSSRNNALALCWNTGPDSAVCYWKQ
jgi:hypothetical protein